MANVTSALLPCQGVILVNAGFSKTKLEDDDNDAKEIFSYTNTKNPIL